MLENNIFDTKMGINISGLINEAGRTGGTQSNAIAKIKNIFGHPS